MELIQAIRSRRSIRRFLAKEIPVDIVKKIISAGTWAPSNCNLQGWHFILLTDKKLKSKLVNQAGTNLRIKKAPLVLVACYDMFDPLVNLQSVSAAIQNMLLAAYSYNIGSCWMASCGNRKKIAQILNLPGNFNLASIVAFGYPESAGDPPPPRKPFAEIANFNQYKTKIKSLLPLDPNLWTLPEISHYQFYYCRKTSLGISMDILSDFEIELVKETIAGLKGPVLDLFTYDGSLIPYFQPGTNTLDLNQQTQMYTRAAAKHCRKSIKPLIFKNKINLSKNFLSSATLLFKAERLPDVALQNIYQQTYQLLKPKGKLIIISRNASSLYNLIYKLIVLKFGVDIRHSAIYSFFGPYQPLCVKPNVEFLKQAGFKVKAKNFFNLPPQLENLYQLYLQYRLSAGTSIINRVRKKTAFSELLKSLIGLPIFKYGPFGSVTIIEARKP